MKAKCGDFAKALTEARLTCGGLADAAGVSTTTVTAVRAGRPVAYDTARDIARVLGKPLADLFTNNDGSPVVLQAA